MKEVGRMYAISVINESNGKRMFLHKTNPVNYERKVNHNLSESNIMPLTCNEINYCIQSVINKYESHKTMAITRISFYSLSEVLLIHKLLHNDCLFILAKVHIDSDDKKTRVGFVAKLNVNCIDGVSMIRGSSGKLFSKIELFFNANNLDIEHTIVGIIYPIFK